MDSFFGRKRVKSDRVSNRVAPPPNELNLTSVPYDKLAPPGRSPIPISAPITNPTLTATGTEFNVYNKRTGGRTPVSPDGSPRTADSSTLYGDHASSSGASTTTAASSSRQSGAAAARRVRQSSSSTTSSGRTDARSPSGQDFVPLPASNSSGYPTTPSRRPPSGMTTRSDSQRTSRYAPSFTSMTDSHSPAHNFAVAFSLKDPGGFQFPRPERDEDIEAMFEEIKETRDVSGTNMTIDQKWTIVHNAAQMKWEEDKKRATQARYGPGGGAQAAGEGTPHWYIMKFLDKTITVKQVQGLTVSLRSLEV